jgi:DNA processing protein
LVEADPSSGLLSRARHAIEQHHAVSAVPGPKGNPDRRGRHHMIRDGACTVETVDDILEDLVPS